MSNLVKFAEEELARVGGQEDGMQQLMNRNVLDIVKMFSDQGHSGFSAGYAMAQIKRLLNWKPLTPLTGEEDEWNGRQNKRYSSVFRDEDGTAYNIEGKIFTDDGGNTWWQGHDSWVPVTFPYSVPDSPIRVYKYELKNREKFKAPRGVKWTKIEAIDGIVYAEGEFYGTPNEKIEYEVIKDCYGEWKITVPFDF